MRASETSRSVRLRMFSMSASARSSRSFISANSRSSEVEGFGAAGCAAVLWASGCTDVSPLGGTVSISGCGRLSLSFMLPGISGLGRKKSSGFRDGQWGLRAEQPADHLGGVVDHRDDAGIVQPGRADHAQYPDDAAGPG